MALSNVGAAIHERSLAGMLAGIQYAEKAGVRSAWLTTGAGPDALMVFAAAAATTTSIHMGTAIVPIYPRHPIVVAQQVADIWSLAPGRLTLGIGPSHGPQVEGRFGLKYERPLEHVREFTGVLKGLLSGAEVDHQGKHYKLKASLFGPAPAPVINSALRERSFELAGEVADGAVTWLCPAPYLKRVAVPALERGSQIAGRPRQRLYGHAFVCLTEDRDALLKAVGESLGHYPRLPNYQEMFVQAGYPEAREAKFSDGMIDAVVLHGSERTATDKVHQFLDESGCDDLLLSVTVAGDDRTAALHRTLDWIGGL